MAKKMTFTLINDPGSRKISGSAVEENGALLIHVDGYYGGLPVAALILQDGRLRLLAFDDNNSDEPKTIELEGAKG